MSWSKGSHLESVPDVRLLAVRQKSKLAQLMEETGVGAAAMRQVQWDADRYVSMSLTERLTFATAVEAVLRSLDQYGRSAGVLFEACLVAAVRGPHSDLLLLQHWTLLTDEQHPARLGCCRRCKPWPRWSAAIESSARPMLF